ncbi:MAG: SPOR domain-containing protein [Bacteroidales bacterium]
MSSLMNKVLFLTLIVLFSFSFSIQSQGIFDRLESKNGKGVVEIHQSESIKKLVGTPMPSIKEGESNVLTTAGYQIHVFSGNKQRASKDEAYSKEERIKTAYPEHVTYVKYNAPFWRLRVGDFRTYEEADELLRDMRRQFPDFAKEMFIVREEIRIVF